MECELRDTSAVVPRGVAVGEQDRIGRKGGLKGLRGRERRSGAEEGGGGRRREGGEWGL